MGMVFSIIIHWKRDIATEIKTFHTSQLYWYNVYDIEYWNWKCMGVYVFVISVYNCNNTCYYPEHTYHTWNAPISRVKWLCYQNGKSKATNVRIFNYLYFIYFKTLLWNANIEYKIICELFNHVDVEVRMWWTTGHVHYLPNSCTDRF